MFRKKKDVSQNERGSIEHSPPTPKKSTTTTMTSTSNSNKNKGLNLTQIESKSYLNDFGVITQSKPPPSFSGNKNKESFGRGYGIGQDEDIAETQLLYGYTNLSTTLEFNVDTVLAIVIRCSNEIKSRGVDTPLILSSMALDLKLDSVSSLIHSYLNQPHKVWLQDMKLSSPLAIGSFLKWGLSRLINERGCRGILSWEQYLDFKSGERTSNYNAKYYTTGLQPKLQPNTAILLSTLLSLFSSISAYSTTNGMPPRKIASLFSAYIFGLKDDNSFDSTYAEWISITNATEHILLAFIRDQKATSGQIPTHLEKFLLSYPQSIIAPSKLPPGTRVEQVIRVRRLARFHSRNLIQTVGTWDVPYSSDWALLFPQSSNLKSSTSSNSPSLPIYTPHYKHLLNIRSTSHLDNDEDEAEMQRFKTVVERDWGRFGESGFKEIEEGKLEFDLSEGERVDIRAKHETLDWGTFASSGFGGRETFAPSDLIFRQNLSESVQTWPKSQQALSEKLRATEKSLPLFNYDTTPHEESKINIATDFTEAWADILVSAGWSSDELKESNFALIQYKSRVREGEKVRGRASLEGDSRTEDRWVLAEEFVPRDYLDQLRLGKKKPSKRISFLRAVRRKSIKSTPRPNVTQMTQSFDSPSSSAGSHSIPVASRTIDNSIFDSGLSGTKHISASRVELVDTRNSDYSPSITSTTGHSQYASTNTNHNQSPLPRTPSPRIQAFGVGETMSSQVRESAFGGKGPVGFNKPSSPKGFLSRIGSKKNKSAQVSTSPSNHTTSANSPLPLPPTTKTTTANSTPIYSRLPLTPENISLPRTRTPSPSAPLPAIPSNRSQSSSSLNESTKAPTLPIKSNRQSLYADADEDSDPYGGIEEDSDVEEEKGEVLFRGSTSYPKDLNRELQQQDINSNTIPQINIQAPSMKSSSSTKGTPSRLPNIPTQSLPSNISSPKPDEVAEKPEKYKSGASAVSRIVGMYEHGNGSEENKKGIKLTQSGFGG